MSTAARLTEFPVGTNDLQRPAPRPDFKPPVVVVFTSIASTLKAWDTANEIAKHLGVGVELIAVQVVPFPLPLNEPPVSREFLIRQFEKTIGNLPGENRVSVYFCRNPMETFRRILRPDSPVVIGARKSWFPNRDQRLAHRLIRAGYAVHLVESG